LTSLRLVDPLGDRPLAPADLPLTLGGSGCAVVVPGAAAGVPLATVGSSEGRLFVEPGPDAALRIAGQRLQGPAWLQSGSVVELGTGARLRVEADGEAMVLVVEHEALPNDTLPPLLEGRPLESLPDGIDRLPIEVASYRPPTGRPETVRRSLRWGRFAVAAAGLAVLAVLGWLLAAVAVTVRTTPEVEPDSVDFLGTPFELRIGGRQLVLPGHYVVAVEAAGYEAARAEATITRDGPQEVVVPLLRLPGLVTVDTGGIGATLSVDGREVGALPGTYELAAGTRELLVRAPRHAEQRLTLEVAGGGEAQSVAVALQPAFAGVTVESVPAGATVSIDGAPLGVTPLEATLDAGRYTLAIDHPGFRRFESPITVKAGEPLRIGPVELGLPDGRLSVRTVPEGAEVSVAGRYRGRSPLTLELAPGVPHEVVASRAGYEAATRTVSVRSGDRASLSLELVPVLGEVSVSGEPADAELFVDGVSKGPARQTLSLPSAPHRIEVRKAGLATFVATVTPKPGLPQVVEYALTTAEQARMAAMSANLTTGLGQQLRLVSGGRFVMGSPRREPGRRSNEAQRTVELKRPFYLGTHEVTNQEFRAFRATHASGLFKEETLDLDRQPAVRVSWQDAAAFCNWLSGKDGLPPAYVQQGGKLVLKEPVTTGYRLPTEAEWEYAARYDGRAATRKYPWGDALPVPGRSGNYADQSAIYLTPVVISGYDDGFRVAAPVGSFAPDALGLFDLGGNVSEWTSDRYSIHIADPDKVFTDPTGPSAGDTWVVRGANWLTGRTPDLRVAWRDVGSAGKPDLGFRLARYAE